MGEFYKDYDAEGGLPSDVRRIAFEEARLGHEIVVYTIENQANLVSNVDTEGLTIRRFKDGFIFPPIYKGLTNVLRRNLDRIDLLHIIGSFVPENVLIARAALMSNIPIVVTPRCNLNPLTMRHNRMLKNLYFNFFERDILNKASAIRVFSNINAEWLRSNRIKNRFFSVIEGGIDDELSRCYIRRDYFSRKYPYLVGKKIVLFMGRLDIYVKGLDLLLEGFAEACKSPLGDELRLVIVGPDWLNGNKMIRLLIEKLGLRNHVYIFDPIFDQEKYSLMASADFLVQTSRTEGGVPRIVREALAVGCPVLVTKETNMGEFVMEYGAGLVVDLIPASIASGIVELIRRDMGQLRINALQLTKKALGYPTIAEQLCYAYRKVINGEFSDPIFS